MFCYDLEVPADFTPVNEDGEVDRIKLWPLKDVIASVRGSFDIKSNCNLVVTEFLVRHGYITPKNELDYIAVVLGLHGSA